MSGLFTSKSQPTQTTSMYDPYAGMRSTISDYLSGQIGKQGPSYGGELTAPLSDAQKESQTALSKYSSNPDSYTGGAGYQAAIDQLSKTVNGSFDPSTSPYYQAMKAEANRNQKLALDTVDNRSGMGNRYYGGGRIRETGDVAAQTSNFQNAILGQLTESERNRAVSASPVLAILSQNQTQLPAQVSQILQTLGALPQQQQQAYDSAIYNQWLNQNYNYPLAIDNLSMGGAMTPITNQNAVKTTDYNSMGKAAGDLLPMVMQLFGL